MDDAPDIVDARGLLCPLPVLRLRKRLMAAPVGARLVLLADDPAAAVDVPYFCAEGGHRLVGQETDGTLRRFTVERGV